IQALMEQYDIPPSRVVIDEDGVGGGVVDEIEGVKGFVNNSKPIPEQGVKRNYANLKSQCTFKAADYINQEKISVYKEIPEHIKEGLITDIEQYQMKDPDKDGKLAILTKDAIKQNIGRSPDYGDAFMMRMFFELTQDEWMVFEDPTGTIF
ncbi:phage portal protein, partial [Candidatus Woesearchaeota archaeon]